MTAQSEGDSVVEDPAAASGGKKDKKDRKSFSSKVYKFCRLFDFNF